MTVDPGQVLTVSCSSSNTCQSIIDVLQEFNTIRHRFDQDEADKVYA